MTETTTPTKKAASAKKTASLKKPNGPSLHDRLDEIVATVGHGADATAIKALAEVVREVTPDTKLGRRTMDPATGLPKLQDDEDDEGDEEE